MCFDTASGLRTRSCCTHCSPSARQRLTNALRSISSSGGASTSARATTRYDSMNGRTTAKALSGCILSRRTDGSTPASSCSSHPGRRPRSSAANRSRNSSRCSKKKSNSNRWRRCERLRPEGIDALGRSVLLGGVDASPARRSTRRRSSGRSCSGRTPRRGDDHGEPNRPADHRRRRPRSCRRRPATRRRGARLPPSRDAPPTQPAASLAPAPARAPASSTGAVRGQ